MAIDIGARTSLDLLVQEASRQLDICNACRYCEGFCAVFPALERHTVLSQGDVSQIAAPATTLACIPSRTTST
jgi:citrate/tricarballylate utilization protein